MKSLDPKVPWKRQTIAYIDNSYRLTRDEGRNLSAVVRLYPYLVSDVDEDIVVTHRD